MYKICVNSFLSNRHTTQIKNTYGAHTMSKIDVLQSLVVC